MARNVKTMDCELLNAGARTDTVAVLEDAFTRADGTTLPVAYSVTHLPTGSIAPGVVVVFRDATQERADQIQGSSGSWMR